MHGVGFSSDRPLFKCCHVESWCGFGADSAPNCRILPRYLVETVQNQQLLRDS